LVAELGPRWQARQDARLADRPRRRAVGAGARHRLVFIDRLLATLVHLRPGVTHDVLGCWCGVSRSTITRAVGKVRPLRAERGCTVEDGIRLRTLADVIAHLGARGQLGLLAATEVRVRRPAAGRAGRRRFVSAGLVPGQPGLGQRPGEKMKCGGTPSAQAHRRMRRLLELEEVPDADRRRIGRPPAADHLRLPR
jgi:hypothetical protein